MSGQTTGGLVFHENFTGPAIPAMTITRWHWSDWPRLVRGQRVTAEGREWRVTDAYTSQSGDETYWLEPSEVVDARITAERADSSSMPGGPEEAR